MANNGHGLGFEQKLWSAADKMRNNMDAAEYKHVVLGLIFLKYISDSFEAIHNKLKNEELADPEDKDEYLAERVFWVPKEARWQYLQDYAKQAEALSEKWVEEEEISPYTTQSQSEMAVAEKKEKYGGKK